MASQSNGPKAIATEGLCPKHGKAHTLEGYNTCLHPSCLRGSCRTMAKYSAAWSTTFSALCRTDELDDFVSYLSYRILLKDRTNRAPILMCPQSLIWTHAHYRKVGANKRTLTGVVTMRPAAQYPRGWEGLPDEDALDEMLLESAEAVRETVDRSIDAHAILDPLEPPSQLYVAGEISRTEYLKVLQVELGVEGAVLHTEVVDAWLSVARGRG